MVQTHGSTSFMDGMVRAPVCACSCVRACVLEHCLVMVYGGAGDWTIMLETVYITINYAISPALNFNLNVLKKLAFYVLYYWATCTLAHKNEWTNPGSHAWYWWFLSLTLFVLFGSHACVISWGPSNFCFSYSDQETENYHSPKASFIAIALPM